MNDPNSKQTELHRLELIVSQLLRVGVLIAGSTLAVGWLWMLWGSHPAPDVSEYSPISFNDSLHWALIMQDKALFIALVGLGVLVLLPLIRVFLTAILFIKQKDYRFGAMAFAVFAALVFSFLLGIEI